MRGINLSFFLDEEEIGEALARHASGDWGECSDEHRELNESWLRDGGDLLSIFRSRRGVKFWVITPRGRSTTHVMLATNDEVEIVDEWPE